jgi:pimeloyl-ACP methyl ester carboxylesterase
MGRPFVKPKGESDGMRFSLPRRVPPSIGQKTEAWPRPMPDVGPHPRAHARCPYLTATETIVTLQPTLARLLLGLFVCACASTFEARAQSATVSAPTLSVEIDGVRIAYRSIGPRNGVPLLLLNRFRGTMDDWDPALIDRIAAQRQVLMFDQPGYARSGGSAPDSLPALAAYAARVVRALGHGQIDVLGFSMGGTVALQFALDHPELLRRLVIAGSGPGYVPELPASLPVPERDRVWPVATKPVNDDADFLFLFFEPTPTSQAAGHAYLKRLRERPDCLCQGGRRGCLASAVALSHGGGHRTHLAVAQAGRDLATGARGQWQARHHGADLRVFRDGAGDARRPAADLPGLGSWFPVPVSRGFRRRSLALPALTAAREV